MDFDELKKSMSTLDDVLAEKSGDAINLNTEKSASAKSRVAGHYRRNFRMCSVLSVVFIVLWLSGVEDRSFPAVLKGFLGIYMGVAATIYAVLYNLIKKIEIASTAPMLVMKQVASLRRYTLAAEIFLAIALAVFFTVFLGNLWAIGTNTFWLVAGALLVSIVIGAIMLPRKIRDFRELTSFN